MSIQSAIISIDHPSIDAYTGPYQDKPDNDSISNSTYDINGGAGDGYVSAVYLPVISRPGNIGSSLSSSSNYYHTN